MKKDFQFSEPAGRGASPSSVGAGSGTARPDPSSPAGHLFKLHGYIGPEGIGSVDLAEALKAHKLVQVQIFSDGGSARSGAALADIIDEHGLHVTVHGATSAAAIAATAGPHRVIAEDGHIGVHPAWRALAGGSDELAAASAELQKVDALLADMLAKRSRLTVEQAARAIRSGRVWTAPEALADGLVDYTGPPAGLEAPPERIIDGPPREAHQLRQQAEHYHHRANLERETRTKTTLALDGVDRCMSVLLEAFAPPARLAAAFDHAAGDAMRRCRNADREPAPPRWQCARCGALNFLPPADRNGPARCFRCNTNPEETT